ncbi:hypothetical protein [Sphingomonas sp. LHG3443-2]|uniref:hypothetical protein n=1 Tax=Sphingomonas sp. LHG3443-2 TaxID=2804639 RepID=UPI003CF646DD
MLLASVAAALAISQGADLTQALRPCETSTTFEAATTCMVKTLGLERLGALRIDQDYDVATYRAIGLAFRLQDPASPVSASMAAKGYYNPDFAPAVLIVMARARASGDGRLLDQPDLRGMVTMLNREADERRKSWPPASLGTRVDLSRCPDTPQRQAAGAACVEKDGRLAVITPLRAQPAWLGASMNKKAD